MGSTAGIVAGSFLAIRIISELDMPIPMMGYYGLRTRPTQYLLSSMGLHIAMSAAIPPLWLMMGMERSICCIRRRYSQTGRKKLGLATISYQPIQTIIKGATGVAGQTGIQGQQAWPEPLEFKAFRRYRHSRPNWYSGPSRGCNAL